MRAVTGVVTTVAARWADPGDGGRAAELASTAIVARVNSGGVAAGGGAAVGVPMLIIVAAGAVVVVATAVGVVAPVAIAGADNPYADGGIVSVARVRPVAGIVAIIVVA